MLFYMEGVNYATKTRITKELIIEKSFEITKSEGIENLNARYLAKQLNCSTMPIFKVFNDMNELKFELKKKLMHITTISS